MRMRIPVGRTKAAAVCAATLMAAVSCGEPAAAPTSHALLHGDLVASSADIDPGLVTQVHASTARFHSSAQASKAGYAIASPCISHPTLGAMGFHWVKGPSVDPIFDPNEPEALVYDPAGKLVAVEYIVIDVGQPAPTFAGHPFDINGAPLPVPHWTLHVWTHLTNPSGIFSPWNPSVICPV